MSAGGKVDIQQIQPHCDEIDRHEDHRVRVPEPHRKQDHDVKQPDRPRGVAGPDQRPVDAPVAEQTQKRRQQRRHRQHEQNAGAVDVLRPDAPVGRERGIGQIARDIRVEHRRPAERTFLFTIGELYAAFDTVHRQTNLLITSSAGCSRP